MSHHPVGMHHKLHAPSKGASKRRYDNREWLVPESYGHILEPLNRLSHLLFFALLPGLHSLHQVGAIGKIVAVMADDQPIKVCFYFLACFLQALNQLHAQRILAGSKLEERDAITQIVQAGALIFHSCYGLPFPLKGSDGDSAVGGGT